MIHFAVPILKVYIIQKGVHNSNLSMINGNLCINILSLNVGLFNVKLEMRKTVWIRPREKNWKRF